MRARWPRAGSHDAVLSWLYSAKPRPISISHLGLGYSAFDVGQAAVLASQPAWTWGVNSGSGSTGLLPGFLENSVQHCLGVLLSRVESKDELGDQHLTRLAEHSLLSRRQAPFLLSEGEIPDQLGSLVDVS